MLHVILLAVVILAFMGRNNNKNIQRLAFLVLFIFAAIRYMYGNDYMRYMAMFDLIQAGFDPFGREWLFTLLCKLMPSFYWLIVVTSGFFVFTMYYFITKNLPAQYAWIGVFILTVDPNLFLINLSSIRQCMAVMVYLYALDMAYKRKIVYYVALVAVAALFHKSLWIMLPLYFFLTDRPVKTKYVLIALGGVAVGLLAVNLPLLAQNVAALFGDKNYVYYTQMDLQRSLRATLLTGFFFIYTLFNLPRLEGKALVYGKLYLLACVLGLFAYQMTMFTRVQMLLEIVSVVALPMIFMNTQQRGPIVINQDNVLLTLWDCVNKYAMPLVLVMIYLLRYYSFFTSVGLWEKFFEYHTIFSLL